MRSNKFFSGDGGVPPKPRQFDRVGAKTYCRYHDCFDCPFEHKTERGQPIKKMGYSDETYNDRRWVFSDSKGG